MSTQYMAMNTPQQTDSNSWTILTDGEFKKSVEHQMQDDMSDEAIENVFNNAARILSNCPNPNSTISLAETGIVIGKVQSGKTSNFISVLALAFDNGYNLAVVLGGNNLELLKQNVTRISNSFCIDIEKLSILSTKNNKSLINVEQIKQFISMGRKVILVGLKHPTHIKAISNIFDNTFLAEQPVIIVDDEGDQATLNTKAYKHEMSSTYDSVLELKKKLSRHCFLSITATPQANVLISAFDQLSPDFGELVQPGIGYCGLREFHGLDSDKHVYVIPETEPNLLDDSGVPDSVYKAMAMFFVGNAVRRVRGDFGHHAMLFHPSQKKIDHEKVKAKISNILMKWKSFASNKLGGHKDISFSSIERYLKDAYDILVSEGVNILQFDSVESQILKCIENCSPVLLCNSEENAAENSRYYKTNIFLGGNLVERGITIKGLAITYIIRRARGKSNVDNMEQRARWFGYKASFLDVCKVYTTAQIKQDFENILQHDEDMWDMISRNQLNGVSFKDMPRVFKLKNSMYLSMTRPAVKRTESFSLSEWKSQRYIAQTEVDAISNSNIIEEFKKDHIDIKDTRIITPKQTHTYYCNISFDCIYSSIFSKLKYNTKEVADSKFWSKLKEAITKAHLTPFVDVVIVRDGQGQTREVSQKGQINQLFQGKNPNLNSPNYYAGDKSLKDNNPNQLHLQIHAVKPKNDPTRDYYSPVVALYIPEIISGQLMNLVVATNE